MSSPQATPPSSRPGSPEMRAPAKRVNAWPDEGEFGLHPDRVMLRNMWEAINKLNLWSWLYSFTPKENEGFMFSGAPEIMAIGKETDIMGHSGASFAFCMRHMEKIAKNGWVEYYREFILPHFSV